MCFSAEASFIGAASLAIIGTASVKLPLKKEDRYWASIPFFFAFQQFCEGIVWLDLNHTIPHSALTVLAKDLYLFFALAFWVIWIPFCFFIAETYPARKNLLKLFLFGGVVLAFVHLTSYSIFSLSPKVKSYSIDYLSEASLAKRLAYLFVVALPPLISSLKYMKWFSVLIVFSCVVAEYFYTTTFTSVWCFLASFISAALYLICRANILANTDHSSIQVSKEIIHK